MKFSISVMWITIFKTLSDSNFSHFHTTVDVARTYSYSPHDTIKQLTICILHRLSFLWWFGDDFNKSTLERSDLLPSTLKQTKQQTEVFPFICIWDIQGFGAGKHLKLWFKHKRKFIKASDKQYSFLTSKFTYSFKI